MLRTLLIISAAFLFAGTAFARIEPQPALIAPTPCHANSKSCQSWMRYAIELERDLEIVINSALNILAENAQLEADVHALEFAVYELEALLDEATADEPNTYVVQAGDTLWGIAERELGDGQRWRELGWEGSRYALPIGEVLQWN